LVKRLGILKTSEDKGEKKIKQSNNLPKGSCLPITLAMFRASTWYTVHLVKNSGTFTSQLVFAHSTGCTNKNSCHPFRRRKN
jgi:hypothetical protein